MKPTNQPVSFYSEVDRARYRANWSCIVWFFSLVVVLALAAWLIARHYGWM